jgi:hypothetical protein
VEILQLPALRSFLFQRICRNWTLSILKSASQSESESELFYDWQFTANQFALATSPWRLTTRNFMFQLNTCGYSYYVTSSLARGWVCRLQLLLVLASAVTLRSESRGTHDHEPFATFLCELASLDSPLRATSADFPFFPVLFLAWRSVTWPPSPSLSLFLPQFLTACTRSLFSGKPSREVVGLPPLPSSILGHFV